MAEYKALLQRKFELPVRQFVIYLGTKEPQMRTALSEDEQITGFSLRNIHNLPVDQTLASDIPEEIILSILADYPKADAEQVVANIIMRLRTVSTSEASLKKSVQQLLVLSRLRKLDNIARKQVNAMPITYDITQDALYKEGIEKKTIQVIQMMLQDSSLTVEQIAKFAGVSVSYVKKLQQDLD